jgi:hypothetical protein
MGLSPVMETGLHLSKKYSATIKLNIREKVFVGTVMCYSDDINFIQISGKLHLAAQRFGLLKALA